MTDLRSFEFRDGFRRYVVSRGGPDEGLDPRWAASLLEQQLLQDSFFGERLASWFRFESMGLGMFDNSRVLEQLLREVESGWVRVRELDEPHPVYSHRYHQDLPDVRDTSPPAPVKGEEILDEARLLRITACPPQFDPRREPLRIAYLLRDLKGRSVELVVRSQAQPEPPVHRRKLTSGETADGPGTLEWDGVDDNTGELVPRSASPFLVELVHDATYCDQAETTLPPAALVHVVEMEDLLFASGRAILMPDGGFDEEAEDGHARATGLHAIAAVLRHAAFHRGQKLGVFGHTDTVGSEGDNLQLSADRATNVLHVIAGEAEAWAAHCDQNYEVADFQRVLKWIAQNKGWATDPGPIDNEFGSVTRSARTNFRALMNQHYGTTLQQGIKQNVDDWKAYFRLYDEELCRILAASTEDLARIRGQLKLTEPASLGCGEIFPADQPDRNNFESGTNRRVDIVFFEPDELPELPGAPPGAPLYASQDYEARYLPIDKGGGKNPVLLRLLDGDQLLSGVQYLIEHGGELLDSGTTQPNGTIFTELARGLSGLVLRLPTLGRSYLLDVAALPPLCETAGAQGRLCNLGYACPISGTLDEETRSALLAFQHDRQLAATGELDEATLTALRDLHDT